MFVRTLEESPREQRGGQVFYLLLAKGNFESANLAITWVEGAVGSQQDLHSIRGVVDVALTDAGLVNALQTMVDAKAQALAASSVTPG